jgi:hypothetical protein
MVLESNSNYKLIYDEGNFKIFERLTSETSENNTVENSETIETVEEVNN